jgi:hypothetical protein
MALPPIVDSGITPEDMMPTEASVEVPVEDQMEMFPNGAEVTPDGEGGAIIEAIQEMLVGQVEEQIPHGANLAEYLDDGNLVRPSSVFRRRYGVSF